MSRLRKKKTRSFVGLVLVVSNVSGGFSFGRKLIEPLSTTIGHRVRLRERHRWLFHRVTFILYFVISTRATLEARKSAQK